MKKLLKKIGFAGLMVVAGAGVAFAAAPAAGNAIPSGVCNLIAKMHDVFVLLRTLAFVGAAFIIAGWAWGYITKPDSVKVEDFKTKGTGMLVGFILLFCIGIVLSFFLSAAGQSALGCPQILNW